MDTEKHLSDVPTRNHGFTLIELMVAMLVGSIIMVSAVGLFKSSLAQNHKVTYIAQLQEEAFLISHVLKQQLAQIGYRPIDPDKLDGRVIPIDDRVNAFAKVDGSWNAGQTISITGTTLNFRYYGVSNVALEADNSIYDCLGNSVPSGEVRGGRISLLDNHLICSNDTDSAVLIGADQGVLVQNIAYEIGVDDDDDLLIDRTLDAADATDTDFINAKLLTIRLLLATPNSVTNDYQSYYFNKLEYEPTDRKLRIESEITMALRN